MPKMYERIRDKLAGKPGVSYDEAQRIGAATYNSMRKPGQAPVTGKHHAKKVKPKKGRSPHAGY
jgi:hypothetical protein